MENFKLNRTLEIPEIQVTLRELTHEPTGAKVLHLANDDPENVFCLSFQTVPTTSNGVAHILEHIVLAGSEKFPIRDPFFSMTRRSLNTFMNAFTGSDFTSYPAASQVEKDFYNLLDVYIDAVFHPKLDRLSFLQEGHRLEFETPTDPASPLQFKGVVFNEMKGVLTAPTSRLYEKMTSALFPDITYGQNSGGDPAVIPDLTYEELIAFHKKFYHPSRCIFYFYGNLPLEKHLKFISEHALKDVSRVAPLPSIPKQKRFSEPKRITTTYPAEEEEKSLTYIAFGWLTTDISNQQEVLALIILETILLSTDASPLKKALLKSGFCTAVSCVMEPDISEVPITLVLNGCKAENADKLEQFLLSTLAKIVKEGIQQDLINSAMHQIELSRTEITEEGYPHGLNLFFRSALPQQHGVAAEEGLKIHTLFDHLRAELKKNPAYFQDLTQKYLIDNPHRVRLVMTPDVTLSAKELKAEQTKLTEIREKLTPEQVQTIIREAKQLEKSQEEEENIDVLPKLSLDDIPLDPINLTLNESKCGNTHVFHHDCFTNEILYADLSFDLPHISPEQWPLLRLFTSLVSQLGCAGRTYVQQLEELQAYTGGIGMSLGQSPKATDPDAIIPTISIHGKSLYRNSEKLFQLMKEMVTSVDFTDIPRLREVIQKQATQFRSALTSNAMNYSKQLAASALRQAPYISNGFFGLPYYHYICHLAKVIDDRPEALINQLQEMQKKALCIGEPHLILSCDSKMRDKLAKTNYYDLANLETQPGQPWSLITPLEPIPSQGLIIPSPVAFTSHALHSVPYVHPDSPALNVASLLFKHITLHKRIREQGGAYGSGAGNKAIQGIFIFYGYRDPNIASTLKAFREAIDSVLWDDFTDEELEAAKFEVIQEIDSPIAPGSRADVAYIWKREERTFIRRRHFRDGVITLTREHLKSAVEKHLLHAFEKGTTVVLAGKELLERENKLLKKPLTIHEI